MKLAVFGSLGMLGREVVAEARRREIDVLPLSHDICDICDPKRVAFYLEGVDCVINCAGSIPQKGGVNYRTNATGPQVIAETCYRLNIERFIQVSTDCVFSGNIPAHVEYTTKSLPDSEDVYGRSKIEGERLVFGSVVRTSFIGPEHGLLRWLLDSKGVIPGWKKALWSGSTVYEVARNLVHMLFVENLPQLCHLAASQSVDKHTLITYLIDFLGLNLVAKPEDVPVINRSLQPTHVMREPIDTFLLIELATKLKS